MEINEALEKYILYLVGEKGLSKNTVSNYKEDLDLFFLHFNDIKDTSSLDDSLLEEYAIYQGEKGLASASIARRLSSLKNFFSSIPLLFFTFKMYFCILVTPTQRYRYI